MDKTKLFYCGNEIFDSLKFDYWKNNKQSFYLYNKSYNQLVIVSKFNI